jgi:large subunit ribosomal protein L21
MKYAIVESGGKQYRAMEGNTIEVDLLKVEPGEAVQLDSVLLLVDGEQITVGAPTVPGAKIATTVVSHVKGPKVVIFKYRPKKRIRTKTGHRQQYTRLLVNSIEVE